MGVLAVLAAALLWSVVPICVKRLLPVFDPVAIAWMRFVMGSSLLGAVALARGKLPVRITARQWRWLALAGAGMGGNYIFYNLGVRYTTAGATNLIVQSEVVGLVILSWLFLGERIGLKKLSGLLLCVGGVVLVILTTGDVSAGLGGEALVGNLWVLAAGLSWSFYGLGQRVLSRQIPPTVSVAGIFGVAAFLSAPWALPRLGPAGPVTGTSVLLLLIVGILSTGAAYTLLAVGFARLSASAVGALTCTLPLFTIVEARILIGEPVTAPLLSGAAAVIGGILLVIRAERGRYVTAGE